MSRYEVTKYHISRPARVHIQPRDLRRLQLLWLRISMQIGGRRMVEIAELIAQAEDVRPELAHAIAWSVYESLRSQHLADGTQDPREQLKYFPTELGRLFVIEAEREAA